jgi:hypothetical protein
MDTTSRSGYTLGERSGTVRYDLAGRFYLQRAITFLYDIVSHISWLLFLQLKLLGIFLQSGHCINKKLASGVAFVLL